MRDWSAIDEEEVSDRLEFAQFANLGSKKGTKTGIIDALELRII